MFNQPHQPQAKRSVRTQRALRKERGFYEFFGSAIGGKISIFAIYSFLGVGLVSCGGLSPYTMNRIDLMTGVNVVNIRNLTHEQNTESTVYLRGKVIRQVPLVDWRVYQLQDTTGSIWVLSKKTNLRPQEQVLIKGKVRHQSIPIAGKDFGEVYLEEEQ